LRNFILIQTRKTLSKDKLELEGRPALDVTVLLREWRSGNSSALNRLLPIVHDELLRIASRNLRRRGSDADTLVPAALVNEAYLRLCQVPLVDWNDRAHFYAVCAQMMRRILVDHARARCAEKRGSGMLVTLCDEIGFQTVKAPEMLDLDNALNELEKLDARQARIVELRFFTGLSVEETAVALGVSCPTVKRDWAVAKAWMRRRLHSSKTQLS
jgi:RNA polymerase sigma factor (TIGR02999 family)